MRPFSEVELESLATAIRVYDDRLADITLIAGWTGLRWSELRALRVRDLIRVPMRMLIVERAAPEGVEVKTTKSRRVRRVPIANRVTPLLDAMTEGKRLDDLLVTTSGGSQLHASAFKRTSHWAKVANGRRIHDLRHTAACLWLARGVDVVTVQTWMGHASIATTNIYLHHLGTGADRAALDLLNTPGHTGGTQPETTRKEDGA
ncbi:tyrosine-type recombinase/integrase [Branchiibius cervicis]|uniref:Tyrosine-type recombinase/integrase n=1 Tax=Branchiibius cervicis TaxID=908252 RepID=A0ABW2AX97_9MICO